MGGGRPRAPLDAKETPMSANEIKITRRTLVGRGVVLGLAVLGPMRALSGCGGEEALNCQSPPGLTPDERTKRAQFSYQDQGTDPSRHCDKCTFFTAAAQANQCGACSLGLGAVNPAGTCNSFAPKT
jgi:hypothetical protein